MIDINRFRGVIPRLNPKLITEHDAQSAFDVDIRHNDLRAFKKNIAVVSPTKSGVLNTIYRFGAVANEDSYKQITGITLSNPVSVNSIGHGRSTGHKIYLSEIVGTTELNDAVYTITVTDDDNYTLDDVDGTSGYSAYVSSGVSAYQNGYFLHWADSEAPNGVTVARSPIAGDTSETTYFTGDGAPKMTYSPLAVTGGTDYPEGEYLLGVPAPTTKPTVAIVGTGTGNPTTHSYVYTYVSALSEEGPPSPVSTVIDVEDGQTVDLSSMLTGPGGNYNFTKKNIYRSVAGSTGGRFYYVGQIDLATETYSDDPKNDLAGDAISSITYDPPPSDLQGIITLPNGVMAGFSGNQLCLSEPNKPHAWPTNYRKTVESQITGIMNFGQTIVVGTETVPYVYYGTTPASMNSKRINKPLSCTSLRSMVNIADGNVIYSSPIGLVAVGSSGPNVITSQWFTGEDWQTLNPSSIHCHQWDDRVVFFYKNDITEGGYILDFNDPTGAWLMPLSFYADHAYSDPHGDNLFLLIDSVVSEFNAGFDKRHYNWKSRVNVLPRPLNLKACQVIASSYDDTVCKIYADYELIKTKTVTTDSPFRCDAGKEERYWELEVDGTDTIEQLLLTESVAELSLR